MMEPKVTVSDNERSLWAIKPTISTHNLDTMSEFSDEALAELLDRVDRKNTYALHMGHDPERPHENRLALHDHLSGAQLIEAVRAGRLWLNVTRIHEDAPDYAQAVQDLYDQLADQIPGFSPAVTTITLLISSPDALVYYHVDAPANLLWHIRGEKTIWIYPPHTEFVSQHDLEDIFADVAHEYIDYQPAFDQMATRFDLKPGQVAGWEPNSPHRVQNSSSFNVSLSTEHYTPAHRRKAGVYQANQLLRSRLGRDSLGTDVDGPVALGKRTMFAVARRLGQVPRGEKVHVPALRVDPLAPDGVRPLP